MEHDTSSVAVIGAGFAGLVCAYELKQAGYRVTLLEASHRVGGRVNTARHQFEPGLHGEFGAMRIPRSHVHVADYLNKTGVKTDPFEQGYKLIYFSDLKKLMTYDEFEAKVKAQDNQILRLFPNLQSSEKGKTPDELWTDAAKSADNIKDQVLAKSGNEIDVISAVAAKYDNYSLRTYFEQVAKWSQDCIRFYETCTAHVVLDNAFVDSWIDGFLSSQTGGKQQGMAAVRGGMDSFAWALLRHGSSPLDEDIRLGYRVEEVLYDSSKARDSVVVRARNGGMVHEITCDYVVFAIPTLGMKPISITPSFSASKRVALRETRYVDVIKILIQFRNRWWENELHSRNQGKTGGCITDLDIRYTVFPKTPTGYNGNRGVILASYIFEDDAKGLTNCSEDELVRIALRDLAKMFGKQQVYGNFEVGCTQTWSRDPYAGGAAFCYFAPDQRSKFSNELVSPEWNGHAVFAGEHTSTAHGWIEGAMQSALKAQLQIEKHRVSHLP